MKRPAFSLFLCLVFFSFSFSQDPAPGCPNIDAGDDQTLDCVPCTDLTATILETGETTGYDATSIPYDPPYPFNTGTPIMVNQDDVWSDIIDLPFKFCFYENMYDQIIVGANGVVTFDIGSANDYCAWSFSASLPSNQLFGNCIFGAYHDIDPSVYGDIYYAILGEYPCRTFVVNYYNVAHFSCNDIATTQQIVLYESTNVIEVYIEDKPTCDSWNSGNALIGVQNSDASQAVWPAGYNTGPWTASNLAFRFTPNGAPNWEVNWYDGNGDPAGTGLTVEVCPGETTTYTAEVVYTTCFDSTVVETDDVTVTVLSTLIVDAGPDQTICIGETADLGGNPTCSGGSPPYSYEWDPSASVADPNAANTTATPSSTTTYTVSVTDAGGCEAADMITITVAAPYIESVSTTPEVCNQEDGTITITAAGGNGTPFTYDIPGSSNQTGNFTGLEAGSYDVTVTDAGGCSIVETVIVDGEGSIASGFVCSDNQCFEGHSFDFTNNGDTGADVTWLWTFQSGSPSSSTNENPSGVTWSAPGQYLVIQTATLYGCTDSTVKTIEIYEHPVVTLTTEDVTCNGYCDGSASTDVSGGDTPYSYSWDNGAGNAAVANDLCAGTTYCVTVSSVYGCTVSDCFTPTEPEAIVFDQVLHTDVTCFGDQNGTITIFTSGGVLPMTYSIPGFTNQTGYFTDLNGGDYTVTATDANGCQNTVDVTIFEPPELVISLSGDSICIGESAILNVIISGGTPDYTCLWAPSGSGTSITVNPTVTAYYSVLVTDDISCTASAGAQVFVYPPLAISLSPDDTICEGESAVITASYSGGMGEPYTFTLNGTTIIPLPHVVQPQTTTEYEICITDACTTPTECDNAEIVVMPIPPVTFVSNIVDSCAPLTVYFNETNPHEGQTYEWDFGDEFGSNYATGKYPSHIYEYPGTYDVTCTVTSEYGCENSFTWNDMITIYPNPVVNFLANPQVATILKPEIYFENISTYIWQSYWSFGDGDESNNENPLHHYDDLGTYNVQLIVETEHGCTDSATMDVVIQDVYTFYAPTAFTPDFDEINVLFSPVGHGIDPEHWYMAIYDRWGEKVFETNVYDVDEETNKVHWGWDGTVYGGEMAEPGVFTWLAIYRDLTGAEHQRAGVLSVIR